MTTERLDSIDARLERLVAASEQQRLDNQELRALIREQGEIISSGIAALSEQLTEFKAITQTQVETTDRLARIVEQLIGRQ